MRKIFVILMILTTFICVSCNIIEPKTELYQITDSFVESLHTTYDSYGLYGGEEYTKYTKDGFYKIRPVGRLINVRIEEIVNDDVYKDLQIDLKEHYKNNTYVNGVYICNGGTIMIDCRN